MRPERFRYEMNRAFDIWFTENSEREFVRLLPYIKRMWLRYAEQEDDFGLGTYGYEDAEDILNSMMYISDRYRCAFRLRWLIDGIENGSISSKLFVAET